MRTNQIGDVVETIEKIKKQVSDNAIILYMKGSPKMPQCGFSARAVQCIDACGVDFAYVDVLADPEIRQVLPQYADWPTFPQLYVKGELVGGSDIIAEMYQSGELEPLLQEAVGAK
jgi:monothiol glutaredoxin